MKTAAQASAKWLANAQNAEDTWAENLQATTKDIVGRAIAQQDKAISRYTESWRSGRLAAALQKVGNQGIKQAAAAKKANYGVGITDAAPRMAAFMGKLIPYINAGLPAIDEMPTTTLAQSKAKVGAWIDYMAAGKGSFS